MTAYFNASNQKGNAMKRVITAAVAALTIATTIAASTATADARGGWKRAYWGYGLAAGVLTAAALGAYAACDRVPIYDRFGNYIGSRRVCDYY